ncbi:unnamed protein product [Protopolystoma xenopodis]|uniref:Uncharacterized protein n=1 Tax=Protopolystoma xenopodis TaxID=117903 RepID=A0A448WSB1_9PLAT|nr:unnamed protein product [Protopolystoma xenopodis]
MWRQSYADGYFKRLPWLRVGVSDRDTFGTATSRLDRLTPVSVAPPGRRARRQREAAMSREASSQVAMPDALACWQPRQNGKKNIFRRLAVVWREEALGANRRADVCRVSGQADKRAGRGGVFFSRPFSRTLQVDGGNGA